MSTIIFSHGKESGPDGRKIQLMRSIAEDLGYTTHSIDYQASTNAGERAKMLRDFINSKVTDSTILVGSSMGGYVSTVIANEFRLKGLFLLCPALYMKDRGYDIQEYHPLSESIEVIHGWQDDIVPVEHSIRFCRATGASLLLVNDGHRLQDSHDRIRRSFEGFLKGVTT